MISSEEEGCFNSTAFATEPPPSYFSAPSPDSVLDFIDRPFETWQSTLLLVLCVLALGGCTIFMASHYAQILRFQHEYDRGPLTLEAQKAQLSDKRDGHESPVTSSSSDGHLLALKRRPRARYGQPKRIAIGRVQEGQIAQRRTSRSRSIGRNITVAAP